MANVTLFLQFGERLIVASDGLAVGVRDALAAASVESIRSGVADQTVRHGSLVTLHGEIDLATQGVPAAVVLFERFGTGGRIG